MDYKATITDTKLDIAFSGLDGYSGEFSDRFSSVKNLEDWVANDKYVWLQVNLERLVNNIRYIASDKDYSRYYQDKKRELNMIQSLKMGYLNSDGSLNEKQNFKTLLNDIKNLSNVFRKLLPPEQTKFYSRISSQVNALLFYAEIHSL